MSENIITYLGHHLAGASGALSLIQSLVEHGKDSGEVGYFRCLHDTVGAERDRLHLMLNQLGESRSLLREAVAQLIAKGSTAKLLLEGLEDGELGRFEALEALSLGIEGKRSLWTILEKVASRFPEWSEHDFRKLAEDAESQRSAVESYRVGHGSRSLIEGA